MDRYEIRIKGQLPKDWSDWFHSFTIAHPDPNQQISILVGNVRDQAELRALLERIWDLNLILISLQQQSNLS